MKEGEVKMVEKIAVIALVLAAYASIASATIAPYINVTGSAILVANPNIAGWWPFEEGLGNITDDVSQNSNIGTLRPACPNCPNWTAGKKGLALLFDGINDYVNVSDHPTLNFTNYSIEAWFNATDDVDQIIVMKGENNREILRLEIDKEKLDFIVRNTANQKFEAKDSVNIVRNRWFHAVGVFNGTHIALFKDGSRIAVDTFSGALKEAHTPLVIGARSDLGGGLFFGGKIDNVRIWNRALTDTEIASLFAKDGA